MISISNVFIYDYCNNNPINITDHTGYESVSSSKSKNKDGVYTVKTKIESWFSTIYYKYKITKYGFIQFYFDRYGNSFWSVVWRNWGKTLSKEMIRIAQNINKKYLKGRTKGGIHTELLIHYALWKCKIKTNHTETADIGSTSKKIFKYYDSNAWYFETAGAANLARKITGNGFNIVKSVRDILKYI